MRSTLFRLTIAATLCAIAAPASAKSAGALLVGSPKACVTARSEFLFHGSGADLIARFGVPRCGASR